VLGARGSRFAGMGIGLATAIKLTPGVFLLYLLVTRQWRAAAVATGTAAAATVGVAVLAPDASREFWTAALFDTNRVGNLAYVANQSLQGVVARWDPAYPSRLAWLVAVLLVVVLWVRRCRVADRPAALATTGALGCLISPVTWTHHLIWLIPALVLTALAAVEAGPGRRRRWLAGVAALGYLVLCSRVVWAWEDRAPGPGTFLLGSAYLWVTVALLVAVPVRARQDVVPAG
jgi:alpha-1,2-mannosyltransferase